MKKGSYTVEAALLMGILVPLLAGILYLGFYVEIRSEVYGEVLENVLTAALSEDTYEGENVQIGEKKIRGSLEKTVPQIPFGGRFFHLPESVRAECTLERRNPTSTIFKIHSLKKLIRQVKS